MFNPFEPFTLPLIPALRTKGYQWLVGQTFTRGESPLFPSGKECVLFSHYNDLGLAKIHLNAVKKDKYACILDLEKDAHRGKLEEMLDPLSKYSVWVDMIRNKEAKEKKMNHRYKEAMRRYISNSTTWRIKSDTTFNVDYEVIFGELQVTMKYSSQVVRIPFSVIENH